MSTSAWLLSTSRAEVPGVSSLADLLDHVVVDPDAAEPVRDGADRSTRSRTADRPEDDQPHQTAQDRPGARGLGGVVPQASDARLLGAGHPDHGDGVVHRQSLLLLQALHAQLPGVDAEGCGVAPHRQADQLSSPSMRPIPSVIPRRPHAAQSPAHC